MCHKVFHPREHYHSGNQGTNSSSFSVCLPYAKQLLLSCLGTQSGLELGHFLPQLSAVCEGQHFEVGGQHPCEHTPLASHSC